MIIYRMMLALVCIVSINGCALLKKNVVERSDSVSMSLSDAVQSAKRDPPLVWRADLLPTCSARAVEPVEQPEAVQTIIAALGELFLGKSIDFAIDAFAQAMGEAAKRDKEGLSFATSSPTYLFDVQRERNSADYAISQRRCIVVARGYLAAPGSTPDWCGKADSGPCGNPARREALDLIARKLNIQAPSFYAEIALDPSDTRDAVSGQLVYLHYPQFLTKRRGDTRDLMISATLGSPAADPSAATKLATFAFTVRQIGEGQGWFGAMEAGGSTTTEIGSLATGWSPLPEPYTEKQLERVAKARSCASAACSFSASPATLLVTVRETGEVNNFVQYMSAWLATPEAQKAIGDPIKNEVLPSKRAATETAEAAQATKLSGDFEAAASSSMSARKEYESACESAGMPPSPSQNTNLALLFYKWETAYKKTLAAARAAGEKAPTSAGPAERCGAHND